MNISYKWLKDYLKFDLTPEETSAALTSIGLETEGVEEIESIRGGLKGLVVGQVLYKKFCAERICAVGTNKGVVMQENSAASPCSCSSF